MEEYLLQLMALIGNERGCIVFATIQRGRYCDLPDTRRAERRMAHARTHGKGIKAGFIANIVFHRHDNDLGEIDGRTSTNSHDQISSRVICVPGNLGSLLARRMLCNSVEGGYMLDAESTPNLPDLIGLGVQGSTDDKEDALGIQSFRLIFQSVRRSFAINDAIDGWKIMCPGFAHFLSPVN